MNQEKQHALLLLGDMELKKKYKVESGYLSEQK